jgi:hypothetical protein
MFQEKITWTSQRAACAKYSDLQRLSANFLKTGRLVELYQCVGRQTGKKSSEFASLEAGKSPGDGVGSLVFRLMLKFGQARLRSVFSIMIFSN